MEATRYVLGEGSSNLLNLYLPVSQIDIHVNQPGMRITELVSVTNLSHDQGLSGSGLLQFADSLNVISHCGHTGDEYISAQLRYSNFIPQLSFGVGAGGMYQNVVRFNTKQGQTFKSIIDTLCHRCTSDILFCLTPIQSVTEHSGHHMHASHIKPAILA